MCLSDISNVGLTHIFMNFRAANVSRSASMSSSLYFHLRWSQKWNSDTHICNKKVREHICMQLWCWESNPIYPNPNNFLRWGIEQNLGDVFRSCLSFGLNKSGPSKLLSRTNFFADLFGKSKIIFVKLFTCSDRSWWAADLSIFTPETKYW